MVSAEREKIEETIDRLSRDIEQEEKEALEKKVVFIEDLDNQVNEKKETSNAVMKPRQEIFKETNELARKLANWKATQDEPVISVSSKN
jgi:hypothetical protein